MSFLIQAKDLCVTRHNKNILENVSVKVKTNDFITIVGPNGAGKSILLDCLMGSFLPDSGGIIKKDNLSLGYIPQNFNPESSMPISVKRFLTLKKKNSPTDLMNISKEILENLNIKNSFGGTYIAMEGPQFSSKAESLLYRSWNCDVIGMTNMPEAKLAREAEKNDLFLPKTVLYQDKNTCAVRFGFGHLNKEEITSVIKKLKRAYNKIS